MSVPVQAPPASLPEGVAELEQCDQWFAAADRKAEVLKALNEEYQQLAEQAPDLAMRTTYLREWVRNEQAKTPNRASRRAKPAKKVSGAAKRAPRKK